jgi:hypothetical protein
LKFLHRLSVHRLYTLYGEARDRIYSREFGKLKIHFACGIRESILGWVWTSLSLGAAMILRKANDWSLSLDSFSRQPGLSCTQLLAPLWADQRQLPQ